MAMRALNLPGLYIVAADGIKVPGLPAALDDRCPHKGGPLSQGLIFGKRVSCPLHNWQIELDSGEAVAPDVGCAHRHNAKVENGRVLLALNSAEKCA